MNDLTFPLNMAASIPYMPSTIPQVSIDCTPEPEHVDPDQEGAYMFEDFVEVIHYLLNAITNSRLLHWDAYRFSTHIAMGELYDGLSDFVDDFAEFYLGQNSENCIPAKCQRQFVFRDHPLQFIRFLQDNLRGNSHLFDVDPAIKNKFDELCGLVNRTRYKLERLP